MFAEPPPQIEEIELEPVLSKGELVVDNWWQGPEIAQETFARRYWLEFVTLVVPVAFAIVYQVFIASNQYVSEARFMVRASSSSDMNSLASLMQDQKVTRASDETYAVAEYIVSRDALDALVANSHLTDILSRGAADFINRFPNFYSRRTKESLYRHFQNFVDVTLESESGIATLRARAFTPDDALTLTKALLADAEAFVNRLNDRIFRDTLQFATRNVDEQRAKFIAIEARLTDYRNHQSIVDPNKESADQLARVGALMTRLSQTESELANKVMLAPRSPQIASLKSDIDAMQQQIAEQRGLMSGARGSLAAKFSEFDQIMLDRTLASKSLESALDQLSKARRDLEQQQYYLQTVVQPNLPDQAAYPRRLLNILVVAGVSFAAYAIFGALLKNVREHQH